MWPWAKSLAVIDLFRGSAPVLADPATLASCVPVESEGVIQTAIQDLECWSIAVFRKHLAAWSIYAGSDFDIESAVAAVNAQRGAIDLSRLAQLVGLQPILAKKHYYQTGNLRWFQSELVELGQLGQLPPPQSDAAGRFVLVLPTDDHNQQQTLALCAAASAATPPEQLVAIGAPPNGWRIRELGAELLALETLGSSRPELAGDSVARREIAARIAGVSADLEESLREVLQQATWYSNGSEVEAGDHWTLSRLASELADHHFPQAPRIHSELVNRQRPSGNTQAGVRELLHAMVTQPDRPALGIESFPIHRGLYSTVLVSAGLHREAQGRVGFFPPEDTAIGRSYQPAWRAAENLLATANGPVPLAALYAKWASAPYGIRHGTMPILAIAFALANQHRLAVYCEGRFQAEVDTYLVDMLMQDERQVAFRWIAVDDDQAGIVSAIAQAVATCLQRPPAREPLEIARQLVRLGVELPQWTRKTTRLSPSVIELRRILLQADDPHQLLLADIPSAMGTRTPAAIQKALSAALKELRAAYEGQLRSLEGHMLESLHHTPGQPYANLQTRAAALSAGTGDFRVDAFAVRLSHYQGEPAEIEAIASLAINRPAREWSDRDADQARLAIADFAVKFCRAETLASVTGREAKREAMALIIGSGGPGRAVVREFEIQEADRPQVQALAKKLAKLLASETRDRNLILAALAEVGLQTDTQYHTVAQESP